jgi:hypothetical protein
MTGAYGYVRDGRHTSLRAKRSNPFFPGQRAMDCFASLATTWRELVLSSPSASSPHERHRAGLSKM